MKQVKNYNKYINQESGRSMVEMLGVLAIIGVLSVGGISGYTTAMNKHKANEILNAAAVRAMAVSAQLQDGAETPTLDEFTENKVGDATFTGVSTSGDKFTIGFSMDNDAVLAQIKNIAGTDGIVRAITSGGLTYNDDLSTGERASDFDGDSTKCDSTKYTYCEATGTCITGANQSASCPADCAALYGENATPSNAEGNTRIGNTGCYCPANTKWTGTECKSTKKFHIIDSYLDHPTAITECAEYDSGDGSGNWSLASADDIGCSYDEFCHDKILQLEFEGAAWSGPCLWLSNCYDNSEADKDGGNSCYKENESSSYALKAGGGGGTIMETLRSNLCNALCVRK